MCVGRWGTVIHFTNSVGLWVSLWILLLLSPTLIATSPDWVLSTAELAALERTVKAVQAYAPTRTSTALTYDALVIRGGEVDVERYIKIMAGLANLGALLTSTTGTAVFTHSIARFMMDDLVAGGLALLVGVGIVLHRLPDFEGSLPDAVAPAEVTQHPTVNKPLRGLIDQYGPVLPTLRPYLDQVDELAAALERDLKRGRRDIRLIQYGLTRTLIDLATLLAATQPTQAQQLLAWAQYLTEHLLADNPKSSLALLQRGHIEQVRYQGRWPSTATATERFEWVQTWYQAALSAESANPGPYLALAQFYAREQRFEPAIAILQDYLVHNQSHREGRWLITQTLATVYLNAGRWPEALTHYQQALDLQPSIPALVGVLTVYDQMRRQPCCEALRPDSDTEWAALSELLNLLEAHDAHDSQHNPYYRFGLWLHQYRGFYEKALRLASFLYVQEQRHDILAQAAQFYNNYQRLTRRDELDRATVEALVALVAHHNQARWQRLKQVWREGIWQDFFASALWWGITVTP